MSLLRLVICTHVGKIARTAGRVPLLIAMIVVGLSLPHTSLTAATVATNAVGIEDSFNVSGSQTVFTSDSEGYAFYRNDNGYCAYRKTTDAGSSWGSETLVDGQFDCAKIVVWYDQWTPGNAGDLIHIVTMETGASNDGLFYNRLDTASDVLLSGSSPTKITSNSSQSPSFSESLHTHSVTLATDGTVYAGAADNDDAFVVSCSSSCDTASNWTEVGSNPFDLDEDHVLLAPLPGGDILAVNRDISANDLRSKVWDGTSWSGSWTTIDSNALDSPLYEGGLSLLVEPGGSDVYLAYVADHDNFTSADHDIRTAIYSGGTWSAGADVVTNASGGLQDVSLGADRNTGDLYAAYLRRSTIGDSSSADVYYRSSTDGASSWSSEQGPVNGSSGNLHGLSVNQTSFERIYATWFDPASDDYLGETIIDIGPDVELAATGTQRVAIRASSSAVHVGGAFTLVAQSTTTLDSVTLTETGTLNASTELADIELRYDLDQSAPYNCASEAYAPSDLQFGSTVAGGFSGPNGTAAFTDSITIGPAQSVCLYPVVTVADGAPDGDTIQIEITDPVNDVSVSGVNVFPDAITALAGTTTIQVDDLTQSGYHWRNDDGTEAGATSATGGSEDTTLSAIPQDSPIRLRLAVAAAGSTTSAPTNLTLQYATAAPSCASASGWTDVDAADDDWNLFDSTFLTNGDDTTNISVGNGGVSDPNTTFLASNGGQRDTADSAGPFTLSTSTFVELEFGLVASTTSVEGDTYCFRVVRDGNTPLDTYTSYPEATIAADVFVSATGTQTNTLTIPSSDAYLGGTFVITEQVSGRSVTDITITESGTIDASTALANVRLQYDTDTTAPYDCASESYDPGDAQFGSMLSGGFSGSNGAAGFSDTVSISTTSPLCAYVVVDVTESASDGDTIEIGIDDPSGGDVLASGATVGPSTPVAITGSTALDGPDLTLAHYHWRNDDGTEADATSATNGNEDTTLAGHPQSTPLRLRLAVSNAGAAVSSETRFRLEFGDKVTTCADVPAWSDVATAGDEWDLATSSNLTNGSDTTNIAIADGGVSDPNPTFISPNGGVRDTESLSGSTTLATDEFVELEYSLTSTNITAPGSTYCFRVTANGVPIPSYDVYPEVSTAQQQDIRVQRGTTILSGTSTTLVAGSDYTAPSASSSAFVRITNSNQTGAGNTTGGGIQDPDEVTAYISDASNLTQEFTFSRIKDTADTHLDWEIIEFVAEAGTDNEFVVHTQDTVTIGSSELTATGTAVNAVSDDSDVVVWITGIQNENTTRNYYAGAVTSDWHATTSVPTFTRNSTGGATVEVSYAVVEFTGLNWRTQRVEHVYSSAGSAETAAISPVNSLTSAFIHAQKRMGDLSNQVVHLGQTAWLSSLGAVSFRLESGAHLDDQVGVAWVIENVSSGAGAMDVDRTNGTTNGGSEPLAIEIGLGSPISATDNASFLLTTSAGGNNIDHPRTYAGGTLTSTSTYRIFRSDTGSALTYRASVVDWPIANLAQRQNYYRFYVPNNRVSSTDPWPPGPSDLGENTSVTALDTPPGAGDRIRLRLSILTANANMPADFQQYKLQYAERVTTCGAVGAWSDVGAAASGEIWRGYAATGTSDGTALSSNPPQSADLLLSVSDEAGTLEHENPSAANPYAVLSGDDLELDWHLEHNGAAPDTVYCFRAVKSDGAELAGYLNYPQLRTADFSPNSASWRWYDDPENETPAASLAASNTAPIDVGNDATLALRVAVRETQGVAGDNARFTLQYSEDATFTTVQNVRATSTCTENALWCYTDGGGVDNATITTALLSESDACVGGVGAGCGTHGESPEDRDGFTHAADATTEYSFTITQQGARVNAVYYFRLFDERSGRAVPVAPGASPPSLVTEGSALTFSVTGLPAGTSTAGVVTTATSTASAINFGSLAADVEEIAGHRIAVDTNATEGYQVLSYARSALTDSYGNTIAPVAGSNGSPAPWSTACPPAASSCFGYHPTDPTLAGGSTRFAADDAYAAVPTSSAEIMYSSVPVDDTHDVIYRVRVGSLQPAGDYETDIIYVAVPVF